MNGVKGSALVAALVVGCSSSAPGTGAGSPDGSTTEAGSDASGPPTGGGPPECNGPCCDNPQAGGACSAANQGESCPFLEDCPGGLRLPFTVVCDGAHWVSQGGDCGDAGTASNGCPSAQPQPGAACTLADGTSCQYALTCFGTCGASASDAGSTSMGAADGSSGSSGAGSGCATVSGRVGPATCSGGHWDTQPLGACPNAGDAGAGSPEDGGAGAPSDGGAGSPGDATASDAAYAACFGPSGVDPALKVCIVDGDCTILRHVISCCGTAEYVGVATASLPAVAACEPSWDGHFPACGCAEGPPSTEDGKTDLDGSAPQVHCVSRGPTSLCETSL